MRSKSNILLVVVAALLISVVLLRLFWATPSAAPLKGDSESVLQWRVGTSQFYDVELESTWAIQSGGEGGEEAAMKLGAVLETKALEDRGAEVLVGMRLREVDLVIGGARIPDAEGRLGRPFRVLFERSGVPASFAFAAEVGSEDRVLLENTVRTFQVSMQKGDAWDVVEPHPGGAYRAQYAAVGAGTWEKHKVAFVEDASAKPEQALRSTERLCIDPEQDWLRSMVVDEVVGASATGLTAKVANHGSLRLLASAPVTAASSSSWRFVAGPADVAKGGRKRRDVAPALSAADAAERLRELVRSLDSADDNRSKWIKALQRLVAQDDALPALLVETMRSTELRDRTNADLYLVLEIAATAAAQRALVSVVERADAPRIDGLRAIVALGSAQDITPQSVAALWGAIARAEQSQNREVASTATLLLGVAGSKLAADDPTRYARLRQDLLAAARGAQDADRKTSLLLSLGNTKDASLAVEVASFLADGDLRVRRAAAQASGSLGIDTIAAPLMKRLAVEPNDVVRAAVIGAMTSWSKPPVEAMRAMRDLADQEQDGGVRQQVARVLAKHLGSYPENAEAMRRMLATEQSEATRRTLASALASAGLR